MLYRRFAFYILGMPTCLLGIFDGEHDEKRVDGMGYVFADKPMVSSMMRQKHMEMEVES